MGNFKDISSTKFNNHKKKIDMAITCNNRHSRISPAYEQLQFLKFEDIREFEPQKLCFK